MRLPWGGLEQEAVGAWDALAARVREWHGTAIISHEILATASRAQVGRALASLGHGDGVEVHVVLSVRDLVRQIPAEWQENVKHRRDAELRPRSSSRSATRAGRAGSPPGSGACRRCRTSSTGGATTCRRSACTWSRCRRPAGPRTLLWQRFSRVLGLDGLELDLEPSGPTPRSASPRPPLLRRINLAVINELDPPDYRPLVRELLAHQTLSRRTGSPRLALPPDVHPWAQELPPRGPPRSRMRGYDVVGDLDDLAGPPARPPVRRPRPPAREAGRGRRGGRDHRAAGGQRPAAGDRGAARRRSCTRPGWRWSGPTCGPTYRLREKAVAAAGGSRAGRLLLRAYRRVRGRSSRSA